MRSDLENQRTLRLYLPEAMKGSVQKSPASVNWAQTSIGRAAVTARAEAEHSAAIAKSECGLDVVAGAKKRTRCRN